MSIKVPVRSRVVHAVKRRLWEISPASPLKYVNTVRNVQTSRDAVFTAHNPPELNLFFGNAEKQAEDHQGTDVTWHVIEILNIRFTVLDTQSDPDFVYSTMEADIQMALDECNLYDTFYPNTPADRGMRIPVEWIFSRPGYTEGASSRGMIFGEMEFALKYWRQRDNPYRWDCGDEEITTDDLDPLPGP